MDHSWNVVGIQIIQYEFKRVDWLPFLELGIQMNEEFNYLIWSWLTGGPWLTFAPTFLIASATPSTASRKVGERAAS